MPLDLCPLSPDDIPTPGTKEFGHFLDKYLTIGQELIQSLSTWPKHSTKVNGKVQMLKLDSSTEATKIKRTLGVNEYWCGRLSTHTQASDATLYSRFKRGLFHDHSKHEQEYIESCQSAECLQVYQPGVEVWKLTYVTPPPTSPRTFVILLLVKESRGSFINISLPFNHPDCPERVGDQKSKVRGRYVSVERVTEISHDTVEWRMATSSDAGGNIPRFVTNSSLASSISEDVPSFLRWVERDGTRVVRGTVGVLDSM